MATGGWRCRWAEGAISGVPVFLALDVSEGAGGTLGSDRETGDAITNKEQDSLAGGRG